MAPYYVSPNYHNAAINYNKATEALKGSIDLALNKSGLNKIFNAILGNCRDDFIQTSMRDAISYMKSQCYYFVLPVNQKVDSVSLDNTYLKTINAAARYIEDKIHSSIIVSSADAFVNNLAAVGGIASCNIIHYNLKGNKGDMTIDITTAWSYPTIKAIRNARGFIMVNNFKAKDNRRTNRFRIILDYFTDRRSNCKNGVRRWSIRALYPL
jgi:hypothetical protein